MAVDDDRSAEELEAELADRGVALFAEPGDAATTPSRAEFASLVTRLLRHREPRFAAALPCLLARHDGEQAANAVLDASRALAPGERRRLGALYRVARCLVVSRAPDLVLAFGRAADLPPLPLEPQDLPPPHASLGEEGLDAAAARLRGDAGQDVVGGMERMFDTWLRLAAAEAAHP